MFTWLGKALSCLSPSSRSRHMRMADGDQRLWSRDLERHSHGEFSFAVVQGNATIEDHSQVVSGEHATFVGVYDGHGGTDASIYVADRLFGHLSRLTQEGGVITEEIIRTAFAETEDGFLNVVRGAFPTRNLIAAVGSCCLVGVIWNRTLYVANLGDSRAVLGYLDGLNRIVSEQLTTDHNASVKEVRDELMNLHPDDPQVVILIEETWRIKGIIQVSRAIGDFYLKMREFALGPEYPRFYLRDPLRRPVLSADPAIITRQLLPHHRFLIFASDGLWDCLSNDDAVKIVHNNPRRGIAKRLLASALVKAGKKVELPYKEIKKLSPGARRQIHDDISVVVVFIDAAEMLAGNNAPAPGVYLRGGFVDAAGPSNQNFNFLPAPPPQ